MYKYYIVCIYAKHTMPYKPAKRTYRKKPRMVITRKPRKAPLNKSQYKAIQKVARGVLYKTAETKTNWMYVDEIQTGSQTGTRCLTHDNTFAGVNFNYPLGINSSGEGRIGNQIQPLQFAFDGHIRIQGASSNQEARLSHCRIVACLYREGHKPDLNLNDQDLLRYGNENRALFGDFRDTYASFNWEKIRPFYDKTFALAPSYIHREYDANGTLQEVGEQLSNVGRDVRRINIKYNFPKGSKLICEDNDVATEWNKNNIAIFVICRNVNDDLTASTLYTEISGLGKLTYKDF